MTMWQRSKQFAKAIPRSVLLVLLVALVARASVAATRPLDTITDDGHYYIEMATRVTEGGQRFMTRAYAPGLREYKEDSSAGPLYIAFLIPFYSVLGVDSALVGVRIAQVLLSIATVAGVYATARLLFGHRAALIGAGALALDPRFALETPDPTTETLYMALLVAGFWWYTRAVQRDDLDPFLGAGTLFGLAALVRPIPLLLPLALAVHALLSGGNQRGRLLKGMGLVALALWLTVTPWIVRNAIVSGGQFIPVSNTGASTFFMGSLDDGTYQGKDDFYERRDEEIGETQSGISETISDEYVEAGLDNILEHPFVYLANRLKVTFDALAQPHGTLWFEGPGIKQTIDRWLRGSASVSEVVSTTGFWPKLAIYFFHMWAVVLGLVGLAVSWRRWRDVLPIALTIAYLTAVYAVLIIGPRYLFPTMPFYWILAGHGTLVVWQRLGHSGSHKQSAA